MLSSPHSIPATPDACSSAASCSRAPRSSDASRTRPRRSLLADASTARVAPDSEAVTTNYDTFFEQASRGAGQDPSVLPYGNVTSGKRGCSNFTGQWIPAKARTSSSREAPTFSYDANRGALAGIVQALLLTRHMLFVGFSLPTTTFTARDPRRASAVARTPHRGIPHEARNGTLSLRRNALVSSGAT